MSHVVRASAQGAGSLVSGGLPCCGVRRVRSGETTHKCRVVDVRCYLYSAFWVASAIDNQEVCINIIFPYIRVWTRLQPLTQVSATSRRGVYLHTDAASTHSYVIHRVLCESVFSDFLPFRLRRLSRGTCVAHPSLASIRSATIRSDTHNPAHTTLTLSMSLSRSIGMPNDVAPGIKNPLLLSAVTSTRTACRQASLAGRDHLQTPSKSSEAPGGLRAMATVRSRYLLTSGRRG